MAFTTHGHHIPGTPKGYPHPNWVFIRCGGPEGDCPKCRIESILSNYKELDLRYSKSEEIVSTDVKTELETVAMVRKPFHVQAVQVTAKNMSAVAKWCGGNVGMTERSRAGRLIKCVRVEVLRATADWQKEARVGDWVVRAGAGYKVYSDKALKESFDVVVVETEIVDSTDFKVTVLSDERDCD